MKLRFNGKKTIRRAFAAACTGLCLAAGPMGLTGCSEKQEIAEDMKVQNQIKLTDENGTAEFNINGKTFRINLYDSENLSRLDGILVTLSVDDNSALYIIRDIQDRYSPRMLSVDLPDSKNLRLAGTSDVVSNVILEKKENVCRFGNYEVISGKDTDGLYKDYLDYVKDNDVKNALTKNFQSTGKPVTLDDLDSSLQDLIDFAVDEIKGRALDKISGKIAVYLGVKVGPLLNAAGAATEFVLAVLDTCEKLEGKQWAQYYRGLCYSDDVEFEIWKAKGFVPEFGLSRDDVIGKRDINVDFISNPLFIVFPKVKTNDWKPPVAKINGTAKIENFTANLRGAYEIWLEPQNRNIPKVRTQLNYSGDLPFFGPAEANFSFIASACEDTNYKLGMGILLEPYTELTARKDKEYKVNFLLAGIDLEIGGNCHSFSDYNTFFRDADHDGYGTEFDRSVSCDPIEGRVTNDQDCDDTNPGITTVCESQPTNIVATCNEILRGIFQSISSVSIGNDKLIIGGTLQVDIEYKNYNYQETSGTLREVEIGERSEDSSECLKPKIKGDKLYCIRQTGYRAYERLRVEVYDSSLVKLTAFNLAADNVLGTLSIDLANHLFVVSNNGFPPRVNLYNIQTAETSTISRESYEASISGNHVVFDTNKMGWTAELYNIAGQNTTSLHEDPDNSVSNPKISGDNVVMKVSLPYGSEQDKFLEVLNIENWKRTRLFQSEVSDGRENAFWAYLIRISGDYVFAVTNSGGEHNILYHQISSGTEGRVFLPSLHNSVSHLEAIGNEFVYTVSNRITVCSF